MLHLRSSELLSGLSDRLDFENVESHSLGEGSALSNSDNISESRSESR